VNPLDPFESLLADVGQALVRLFMIMNGDAHGIYQGTHEAALFEAQGGQIGAGGFNHLDSLRQTAAAIQTRQDALNAALGRLRGLDPLLGDRVKQICQPILQQSGQYLKTAADTESAAVSLRTTDPTRFEGVILGEGGLGPEIGRTSASLVSNQLNKMSVQLMARGIETRLIPAARASLQSVMIGIRQLPTDVKDALAKLTLALTTMRQVVAAAVRQALLAGRVLLGAALAAIEEALVALGSRLTSGFIIIPKSVLQQFGGGSDVEA
jgi:hypothetical protein